MGYPPADSVSWDLLQSGPGFCGAQASHVSDSGTRRVEGAARVAAEPHGTRCDPKVKSLSTLSADRD